MTNFTKDEAALVDTILVVHSQEHHDRRTICVDDCRKRALFHAINYVIDNREDTDADDAAQEDHARIQGGLPSVSLEGPQAPGMSD